MSRIQTKILLYNLFGHSKFTTCIPVYINPTIIQMKCNMPIVQFNQFISRRLKLTYIPVQGQNQVGTQVFYGYSSDPHTPRPEKMAEAIGNFKGIYSNGRVESNVSYRLPQAVKFTSLPAKEYSSFNLSQYSNGVLCFCTEGGDGSLIGQIWMDFAYTLISPRTEVHMLVAQMFTSNKTLYNFTQLFDSNNYIAYSYGDLNTGFLFSDKYQVSPLVRTCHDSVGFEKYSPTGVALDSLLSGVVAPFHFNTPVFTFSNSVKTLDITVSINFGCLTYSQVQPDFSIIPQLSIPGKPIPDQQYNCLINQYDITYYQGTYQVDGHSTYRISLDDVNSIFLGTYTGALFISFVTNSVKSISFVDVNVKDSF